jgi:hypothetical protein
VRHFVIVSQEFEGDPTEILPWKASGDICG